MAVVDKGNILSLCKTKTIYLIGEDYYLQDYVFNIEHILNKDDKELIKAQVASNTYSEYLCKLLIDKDKNLIEYGCTCEDFEKKKKICPHIVAAYLKYINEYFKGESNVDRLLKVFRYTVTYNKEAVLNMEIELSHSSLNSLVNSVKLRVGKDKLYPIKDIKTFITSYNSEDLFTLYRSNILDFSREDFKEEYKGIIDFIRDLLEIEEKLMGYNNFSKKLFNKGEVFIPNRKLKDLLELIGDKSITVNLPIGTYFDVTIKKDDVVLEFLVIDKGNKIALGFKDREIPYPLLGEGGIYFYKGGIYFIKEEKERIFSPLFDLMLEDRRGHLEIDKEDSTNFASFILPKIKNIGRVFFEEGVKKLFYEEELKCEFYIDKNADTIGLRVIFIYEDMKFNPLHNDNKLSSSNGILIREVDKEKDILEAIEGLGFSQEEEGFTLIGDEAVIDFIVEGVNLLQGLGEVYYSEEFKNIKVYSKNDFKYKLKLNREDMLEFSFSIEGINEGELLELLNNIKEGKRYYKLKGDGIVLLNNKDLKDLITLVNNLGIEEKNLVSEKIIIPKFFASYVNDKIGEEAESNREFRELINNLRDIKHMDYYVPEDLSGSLRSYQKTGYKWFKTLSNYGFGGILADEMGLGKTIQTIAFVISSKEDCPSLIVCPTSLVYNWKEEFEKFAKLAKIVIVEGSRNQREELWKTSKDYDVVITSYPLIRRDIDFIENMTFNYVILDEAQNIKNFTSQNAKAVKEIKAKNRFALTGTPVENHLSELWSIFDFVMPGYLLNHSKFLNLYETAIVKHDNKHALEDLKKRIAPFILRRLKKDVAEELPPKIEKTLSLNMDSTQKNIYASYVTMFKKQIKEEINLYGFEKSKIKILGALTRLRQICCDPSSFIEDYAGESAKMNALIDLIDNSIEGGHKILVFSQFVTVLKNISSRLNEEDISHLYLDGSVSSKDRMTLVKNFNEGEDKVFLISLKAGGAGLNLTSADIVIHFDPWWNPAIESQATDRAHRIGQKNTVEVIKLITKGTIEEKILKIQEEKQNIINSIMDNEDLDKDVLSSMSIEDIEDLFT
ncbi:SNF2 helicase associated domain-containing protein [Clostridium hydrogeniformans]|uniref:SNF2 helicase associated domain-containing protein n=1 Tax=Clostridium hydrogeniformans TaxID=349933 RepID=UPI000480A635|nr:SNF2 helicase associated domain-containing protein [Clostridium hydrogeniformans]